MLTGTNRSKINIAPFAAINRRKAVNQNVAKAAVRGIRRSQSLHQEVRKHAGRAFRGSSGGKTRRSVPRSPSPSHQGHEPNCLRRNRGVASRWMSSRSQPRRRRDEAWCSECVSRRSNEQLDSFILRPLGRGQRPTKRPGVSALWAKLEDWLTGDPCMIEFSGFLELLASVPTARPTTYRAIPLSCEAIE